MDRNASSILGQVLVVEDDPSQSALVSRWLENARFSVNAFADAESCLAGLGRLLPDALCLDLTLPGMSGIEALERIRHTHPSLPVIMLTANDSVEMVVQAMQAGAYDYLVKPVDRTKLVTTVSNAIERHSLAVRVAQLEREAEGGGYPGIIGNSASMRELFRQMDRVAPSDITVLIHGESGTGKEVVARALHQNSGRSGGPMVAVNCAAIPESLQESELFGHEKGSFTGADRQRQGKFELADGGTLFLDEVAELSPRLQAELLRVLQERRFTRVGGNREIQVDIRLIAATHRDLAQEVEAGRFRSDLFFRLAVFELEIPPLRNRQGDIQPLAASFLLDFAPKLAGRQLRFAPETLELLLHHAWPGNVRELQNAVQRAVVSAQGELIQPSDLPPRMRAQGEAAPRPEEPAEGAAPEQPEAPETPAIQRLEDLEREAILQAVDATQGNLSEAGRMLGIGRTTLYRKLKKYGIH